MCDSWTPTKPYAGAKWPSAYPPTHTHPHTLAHTTQARSYVASLSQAHLRDKILHHQVCVRARACARACCVLCARRGRTSVFNCLSHTAPIGLINNDPPFCPPLTTTDPSACLPQQINKATMRQTEDQADLLVSNRAEMPSIRLVSRFTDIEYLNTCVCFLMCLA